MPPSHCPPLPLLAAFALCLGVAVPAAAAWDDDFTGGTLRLDLYHAGTAGEARYTLDRVRVEGPWPGSRTQLLDPTGLGESLVEMVDARSNRLLYSHGFATIFGEWQTTAEALEGGWRVFAETVRLPEPRRPVQVRLRQRGADGAFHEVWSTLVDPRSRFVDRAPVGEQAVWTLFENGPAAVKVDLLVLGDGYTAAEREKFHRDAERMIGELFRVEPYASRRGDFNVRAIDTPAPLSGISRPRAGVFRDSPLGARYNTFDSERYVLALDEHRWRDVAAAAPYDSVILLVNDRKYGGGGIFGLYATAAADSAFAPYLMVHELGHSFAGLGDEYYTSDVAYEATEPHAEPWAPNVTADGAHPKWHAMVTPGTPLPSPWDKEEFERMQRDIQQRRRELLAAGAPDEALEQLFREERELMTAMLGAEELAGRVGAFEGAQYEAEGLFRPQVDCLMFTRDEVGFCAVCHRAIERVIDLYSR